MPQTRIFLQGESTTYGYGDSLRGGWAGILKSSMMTRASGGEIPAREVINLAISSQSADQIAQRLPKQIDSLGRPSDIAIFMVGMIDSVISHRTGELRLELPAFRQSIKTIGNICLTSTIQPIFIGYYQVDETRANPWRNGDRFTNANVRKYRDEVAAYCADTSTPYVALEAFEALPYDETLANDGLHPSPQGHQLIYEAVAPSIDRMLKDTA